MKPVPSRKEETRRRIVDTAARLFLEKGVDRVGVDEIMREPGPPLAERVEGASARVDVRLGEAAAIHRSMCASSSDKGSEPSPITAS